MCVIKQPEEQPQKSHEQDIVQKHLQIDRSIDIWVPWTFVRPWGFLCIRTQDVEETKSMQIVIGPIFSEDFQVDWHEKY